MMNTETLGMCGQQSAERHEYLALSFSPLSVPLRSRWRNNGLSADFLGDYVMTFLPGSNSPAEAGGNHVEIRHAVAYIANEFLENAMKYHDRDLDVPIGIRLELTSEQITVHASNAINHDQKARYKSFIEVLQRQDAADLLMQHLEAGSANSESAHSCLGLLTMISDYGARLGWRFDSDPANSKAITVTTSAVLALTDRSAMTE